MRPYQLQGLNWMVSLHHNGLNGILADEMVSFVSAVSSDRAKFFRRVWAKLSKRSPSSVTSNTSGILRASISSLCQSRLFRTGRESSKDGHQMLALSSLPVLRRIVQSASQPESFPRISTCSLRHTRFA